MKRNSARGWHEHPALPVLTPTKDTLVMAGLTGARRVEHSHAYGLVDHDHSATDAYASHGSDIIVDGEVVGVVR